jgi:hypothetical protein
MKAAILSTLALVAALGSAFGHAQSVVNVEPVNGLTIQHVYVRSDGWAGLIVAEQPSEFQHCGGTTNPAFGSTLTSSKILWMDMGTASGKQLYNSVLAAYYAAKKLEQVVVVVPATFGDCSLFSVRVGP